MFFIADSNKLLCFRYYGGINLLCFAQSEPVDFESTYKLASEKVTDDKTQLPSSSKKFLKDTAKKKEPAKNDKAKLMGNKQNGYSSESETENESSSAKHRKKGKEKCSRSAVGHRRNIFKIEIFYLIAGWRLLRKKSSLPNGFPRSTGSDKESNSEGSDSARTQIEFPTWNSHESTQKFLDTAEDKKYYRIWIDPSDTIAENKHKGERYETVFPAENPPPLPPRSYHMKHRPLERTKALEHGTSSPPKVSRHYKPFYPIDVPAIPPRPKKLVHPEDAFDFEIIDIDEQTELRRAQMDVAPLATPESEFSGIGSRSTVASNHSSQNCDIKVNPCGRVNPPRYPCNGTSTDASHESCRLTVPEPSTSVSPISPNSGNSANSVSTPTSDSGVAFSEVGFREYSSSSTESEFESTKAYKDGIRAKNTVRGHKLLSRQISHPPDNCVSQFLRNHEAARSTELQCPPTPTHHPRKFKANDPRNHPSPVTRSARNGISEPGTSSPYKAKPTDNIRPAISNSSDSDSDVPSQSLRRRTMRLPSISENSRIQRVDVLPDGDRLPPGQ